jgi:CubicO group peptidase (beta-lactamase class C family)
MKLLTLVCILFGLCLLVSAPSRAHEFEGFDDFVEEIMAEWQVPGLAVAAVRDGEVVLSRTYGLRDAELGLPVTTRTLFALGSVTKTFTTTGLAILAEEGRLDWDRPVWTYMPDFELMDRDAGRRITPRHLVTHSSGLPRHDVLWYAEAFDRREMFRRLRFLEPTKRLGTTFQYQNLMFMTAGMLAGRLSGTSWEDFTQRRLLDPLGMTGTRLSLAGFLLSPDIAMPHFPGDEGRVPIALLDTDGIGPASSVYANLEDMTRYLRFHVAAGRLGERRLLSARAIAALGRVEVPFAAPSGPRDLWTRGYGLGFYVASYRGQRMLRHGGAIDGYLAWFSLLPEDRLGVVVLSNLSGGNPVPRLVTLNLYDRLLGLEPLPWVERRRQAEQARQAVPPEQPPEGPGFPPRFGLESYAGRYEHPAYGAIRIDVGERGLRGRFNHIGFRLEHLDGETWRAPETAWPLREGLEVTFLSDGAGAVDRLATPIADGPTYRFNPGAMTFRRVP